MDDVVKGAMDGARLRDDAVRLREDAQKLRAQVSLSCWQLAVVIERAKRSYLQAKRAKAERSYQAGQNRPLPPGVTE